jgi:hypothetical protein
MEFKEEMKDLVQSIFAVLKRKRVITGLLVGTVCLVAGVEPGTCLIAAGLG